MTAPRFWSNPPDAPGLAARLLTPLGMLYGAGTARRLAHAHTLRIDVPVICVANKADDRKFDDQAADFYRLGRGRIVPVSTKQNRNRSVLLNLILERLPEEDAADEEALADWIERNYLNLFETELEGWYTDQDAWPENLSLGMFYDWFEVECHSALVDTLGSRIFDDEV